MKKKNKWGSIRYKQANNIYGAKIQNQIKGTLCPGARTGAHQSQDVQQTVTAAQYAQQGLASVYLPVHVFPSINSIEFAAERPVGRIYRSIAVGAMLQEEIDSQQRRLNRETQTS